MFRFAGGARGGFLGRVTFLGYDAHMSPAPEIIISDVETEEHRYTLRKLKERLHRCDFHSGRCHEWADFICSTTNLKIQNTTSILRCYIHARNWAAKHGIPNAKKVMVAA